eukprot:5536095-Ditylum_brightwellii.AAC.1
MLVNFWDNYYIYQGAAKGKDLMEEDTALAIGGYESAFLVDLIASYNFETTEGGFKKALFWEIYRHN